MSGSRALVSGLSVVVLSVSFAALVFGQVPPNRTQTKPPVNETRGGSIRLPPSIVPLLFGMKRVEVVRALEPLHLRPKFLGIEDGIALAQDPAAGTSVPYGSGVAVTLGRMPELVLKGPPAPAYVGSELTFTVSFVPPLPAGPKAIYQFTWGDGSPTESTANAVVTHRFVDAGARVVSVIWTLNDRVKIGSARVAVDILPLPPVDTATSYVPLLFGMNRVEVSRVLEPLGLQPKFSGPDNGSAMEQKPPAGTRVRYGSAVAVTLGMMPQLVLKGPAAPAYVGKELTFSVAFVPPLPAGPKAIYHFTWGDGSPTESTGNTVVTHRFADAGARPVSVIWTLSDGVKIGSAGVVVEILPVPPPPSDTAQTATVATSDTSATVSTDTAASQTTVTTTTSDNSTTTVTTTTEPTTATASTTTSVPTPGPPNLLVWIGAAAVILLLVVTFLLARVLRALNRKPPKTQAQAKSPVAFNGGVRAVEYEIEHPELIRRRPEVGLRGGVRAEEGDDV
ncbi:MAG: hypothetical protein JO093_19945 [Acidobacteria bacterium]|nr:hypothetical protein [Acidobacteriota bacterium]MBV9187897.1 hypothetical protein [Acidobacteriota bacterium]